MNNEAQLLPCPFCGGEAKLSPAQYADSVRFYTLVRCTNCGAQVPAAHHNRVREREIVIAAWNNRTIGKEPIV